MADESGELRADAVCVSSFIYIKTLMVLGASFCRAPPLPRLKLANKLAAFLLFSLLSCWELARWYLA